MAVKAKTLAFLILAWLLLLMLHAPARLLYYVLPPALNVGDFSGSLWRGSLHQLSWQTLKVDEIRWHLTFAAALCPAFRFEFRDPQGIRGQGTLCGWQEWRLFHWQLSAPADYVWQQFAPPTLPVAAQGRVQLTLSGGTFNRHGCSQLRDGIVTWQQGKLNTPLGELLLATPTATFNCEQQNITLRLQQNSPQLRLTGRGNIHTNGSYHLNGQFFIGEHMPAALKPLLTAAGQQGTHGDITWRVDGQLK